MTPIGVPAGTEPGSAAPPVRLLLLSPTGDVQPALRRALRFDDAFRLRPATLAQSADVLDEFDVVVIDAGRSVTAGLDTLVGVRRRSGVPAVFVAGRGAASQAVQALELGADDFVVEPFANGEVPARIRSVLRRCRRPGRSIPLVFGRLTVHMAEREVRLDGRRVETTPLEFDLLARLVSSPRQVFSRAELLEQVWGSSGAWQSPATVTEHIRRLRLKLEADRDHPRWLRTVRGVGYRFDP